MTLNDARMPPARDTRILRATPAQRAWPGGFAVVPMASPELQTAICNFVCTTVEDRWIAKWKINYSIVLRYRKIFNSEVV